MFGNDPPSSADYAWDAATSNSRKIEALENRVRDLERLVAELQAQMRTAHQTDERK